MPYPLRRASALILAAWLAALAPPPVLAATPHSATQRAITPLTWPRQFQTASEQVELYQPDIERWDGNQIAGRAAVAVGARNGAPTYGVVHFSAMADIDKPSSLVQLTQIRIDSVEVPTDPAAAEQVRSALVSRLPADGLTVPLDELQASYAVAQQLERARRVPVRNDVPQVFFATTPTLLVLVDGEPHWRPVPDSSYERALNSRALLLRDSRGALYLHAAGYWYVSEAAGGEWTVLAPVPQALLAAAKTANASLQSDPMLPADHKKPAQAPTIVMSTQPAELVVTTGAPQMTPVTGAGLLTVSNADHAVFVDPDTNQYYVLLSGRWFRAPMLTGPWQYVPGNGLPAAFARISPQDAKANVLVSVPGTPQAREAEIAATIPQTATVSRSRATLAVAYDGAPRFEPITGTSLRYAVNTGTPVIEVSRGSYYAVANGVWFTAPSPTDGWVVATSVPSAIYTIPVSSPLYYVTYVRIYSVTGDTVVVGYTPGYVGVVVAPDGTVVYGTGYVYPAYVGGVYYGYPVTYGYGAGFALSAAEGFAFGFAAGWWWGAAAPYWGPYWHGGAYNWNYVNVNRTNFYGRWGQGTVTHASGWNAWTGTEWRGTAGAGYNPATGARFAGHGGAAFNPYSGNFAGGAAGAARNPSTGRGAAGFGGAVGNAYTGQFAAGGHVAGYDAQTGRIGAATAGVAGNANTGQVTAANRGFVANPGKGNAVAWDNGNVYAGHDGNIYQHTANGWEQHTQGGWQPVQGGNEVSGRLDQQRQAREVGQQRFSGATRQWPGAMGGGGRFAGGGFGGGGFGGRGHFGGGFHGRR